MYMKKRCITCNKTRPLDEFNKNHKTKDGRQSSCRLCTRGYDRKRLEDPVYIEANRTKANNHYYANRTKKRIQVAEYQTCRKVKAMALLGSKCKYCPETHPAALQFHHRDPKTKLFNITTKMLAMPRKWPWEIIEAEIAKCDLLCANCHAKHHSVLTFRSDEWVVDTEKVKELDESN